LDIIDLIAELRSSWVITTHDTDVMPATIPRQKTAHAAWCRAARPVRANSLPAVEHCPDGCGCAIRPDDGHEITKRYMVVRQLTSDRNTNVLEQ
jgi:hypothetical protein